MKVRTFLILFVTSLIVTNTCYSQDQIHDSLRIKINNKMIELKERSNAPSVVLALIKDHEIVFSNSLGYTDLEKQTPASIDSKYAIASITKTFVASILMELADNGTLNLLDNINKYIPELQVKSEFGKKNKITLLQLATHTSGLPRNSQADIESSTSMDRWFLTGGKEQITWFPSNEDVLASLSNIRLDDPPYDYIWYSNRHYSNLGYTILGIALERASSMTFEKHVKEKICIPLGMNNTGFLNELDIEDDVASTYWINPTTRKPQKSPLFQPNSALYPGGMYSSARDLTKYLSSQFNGEFREHNNFLSEYDKRMMQSLKIGWKPDFPFVHHSGHWSTGILGSVYFHPKLNVGWVILVNSSEYDMSALNKLMKSIAHTIAEKRPKPDLKDFVGTYELDGGAKSISLFIKNNKLYSSYLIDFLPDHSLKRENDHRFVVEGDFNHKIEYSFNINSDGQIKMFRMGQLSWYKKSP